MAVPTNRDQFKEYCLRALGEPVIKVNVASQQVDDRVDEALFRFYERHTNAVEEIYAIFKFSHEDIHRGFVYLPEDIVGVSTVYHASNTSNIYSIDFLMRLGELQALSKTQYAGIMYYYTIKMHLELLDELFDPDPSFNFNPLSHKLILQGGVKNLAITEGVAVMRCYRKITDENADEKTLRVKDGEWLGNNNQNKNHLVDGGKPIQELPKANIWQDRWLQKYAQALIKKQWATNVGKYGNISLLGGVTINGAELLAEANAEIAEFEQQLLDQYSPPVIGFWG